MIGAKLSDQRNSSNAGRFKSTNQRLASHGFSAGKPKNREKPSVAWIPLIAEFGTDHIEKAVFVTSASIFSETVREIKLKFGEGIEKKPIYQDPSPFTWDFQYFCVNSSLEEVAADGL